MSTWQALLVLLGLIAVGAGIIVLALRWADRPRRDPWDAPLLDLLRDAPHYLEHSNEAVHGVHSDTACYGQWCPIHNMSLHSMRAFPQHWRDDRSLMERVCPHGIGHPDPDSPRPFTEWTHGCDGCCANAYTNEEEA